MNFLTLNWRKLRSLSLTYDFSNVFKPKVIKGISAGSGYHINLFYMDNYREWIRRALPGNQRLCLQVSITLGVPAVSSVTFGFKHYILIIDHKIRKGFKIHYNRCCYIIIERCPHVINGLMLIQTR